jgi:hypothetical protein
VAAGLAIPATATAATNPPTATTGGATAITPTNAIVHGSVNPRGTATSYHFIYGTTKAYGASTGPTPVGAGTTAVKVTAPLNNLAPATTYHYRIVAQNAKGLSKGKDRTFKTHRQPLGLVLTPSANPLRFMASTVLTGQLTGTGNAGQQVILQANPWPYLQGFANVGNALVTDPNGAFTFPLIGVPVNTQYRVLMPDRTSVVSPIVSLGVKVAVHTKARPRLVHRGRRVRFSGTIAPGADGSPVLVQKRVRGAWTTVAHTVARHRDASSSSFRRRVRLRHHGGTFRILVDVADGAHVANYGRSIVVHVRR